MSEDQKLLLEELQSFVTENGLEMDLEMMRTFLRDGYAPDHVSFLLRDRYTLDEIEAVAASLGEDEQANIDSK